MWLCLCVSMHLGRQLWASTQAQFVFEGKIMERMLSAQRFSKGEIEVRVGNSDFYNFHFCVLLERHLCRGPVRGHACTF